MAETDAGTSGAKGGSSRRKRRISEVAADPEPLRVVVKRDGREVPFQVGKIEAAIGAAMRAAADPDIGFAGEVAAVVELALRDREARRRASGAGGPPHIEEVQDLVERALMELGRPAVAKAYILYRDRRARVRGATGSGSRREDPGGAGSPRGSGGSGARVPVVVHGSEGREGWSKGQIAGALIEEARLPRPLAEEIASAVEARVLESGLRRVTAGLVRELVAGELLDRGLSRALSSQRTFGLHRSDVRRALREPVFEPWAPRDPRLPPDPAGAIAGEILRRFALEDVLGEGVAALHREGDLHVVGLGRLERPLSLAIPLELLAPGPEASEDPSAYLEPVAELARSVTAALVLERPAAALAASARRPRALGAFLRGLAAIARAAGVELLLGSSGSRHAGFAARLVEELAGPAGDGSDAAGRASRTGLRRHDLALVLEGHELEAALAARPELAGPLEVLLAEGRVLPSWNAERTTGPGGVEAASFAGPGLERVRSEAGALACTSAVALNLPRLARRAGAWREDALFGALVELVRAALEGAAAIERFQREEVGQRPIDVRARRSVALVPVGLREALARLGDGELDPAQGARLLALLHEAALRFAPRGVRVVAPCPFFAARAAARFAMLDERAAREENARQRWLFAEAQAPEVPRPYSQGFLLHPVERAFTGRAEAECLRTLRAGALSFSPAWRVSPALRLLEADATPCLSAWKRFEVLRRAHRGELSLELFHDPRGPRGPGGPDTGGPPGSDPHRPRPELRPLV